MQNWINTLRTRSLEEKRFYSMIGAAAVVAVLFLIWISTTISGLGQEVVVEEETQKASVIESVKRKADLLFGSLGQPIEYKSDESN